MRPTTRSNCGSPSSLVLASLIARSLIRAVRPKLARIPRTRESPMKRRKNSREFGN
jgi:hypothetical protein